MAKKNIQIRAEPTVIEQVSEYGDRHGRSRSNAFEHLAKLGLEAEALREKESRPQEGA